MMEEALETLASEKARFDQAVRDEFGNSISKDVFDKMTITMQQMQATDKAAKIREAEITALTAKLRFML